jgi:hypothetical protein
MTEVRENNTFEIQCRNPACTKKERNVEIVHGDEKKFFSLDSKNWRNARYCPACAGNMSFWCSECGGWHEVGHLSVKPYICPTVINTAINKYESALVSYLIAYFIPIAIWFIIVTIGMFLAWPATEIVLLGHNILISDYPLWSALLIIPFGWLIGCSWVYIENKKRKANFQKECSKEWELMQRFPNRVQ